MSYQKYYNDYWQRWSTYISSIFQFIYSLKLNDLLQENYALFLKSTISQTANKSYTVDRQQKNKSQRVNKETSFYINSTQSGIFTDWTIETTQHGEYNNSYHIVSNKINLWHFLVCIQKKKYFVLLFIFFFTILFFLSAFLPHHLRSLLKCGKKYVYKMKRYTLKNMCLVDNCANQVKSSHNQMLCLSFFLHSSVFT